MAPHLRIRLLVLGAVVIMAGAVWLAGDRQRAAANGSLVETDAAQGMYNAMQDLESGLAGYNATGRPVFLERYERARQLFDSNLERAKAASVEQEEKDALARQERIARRWQRGAGEALLAARSTRASDRRTPVRSSAPEPERLDRLMRAFRAESGAFQRELREERDRNEARATTVTTAVIAILGALFGAIGFLGFERRARHAQRRRDHHARFADVLQLARSEQEAHGVLKLYLERVVKGGTATVLNRNNSANRLEPTTTVEDPSLRDALVSAEPESCMAIRGGRTHQRAAGDQDLMRCEICGCAAGSVTCVPSLVGGEVIGSVLIEHPRPLGSEDVDHISSSISEAAPVLANMRNLAIAEFRAATDALTGLANARSVRESLKLMVAQAGRTASPLAAVMFDLDHFKKVNDGYGHDKGDELLAAVGDAAANAIRTSDVVGRYGGEEFLALLPNTDREGAATVAEKIREAISAISLPGLDRSVTASFGIAVYPDDAVEPDQLLRMSDRALYRAKSAGRDRVEVIAAEALAER